MAAETHGHAEIPRPAGQGVGTQLRAASHRLPQGTLVRKGVHLQHEGTAHLRLPAHPVRHPQSPGLRDGQEAPGRHPQKGTFQLSEGRGHQAPLRCLHCLLHLRAAEGLQVEDRAPGGRLACRVAEPYYRARCYPVDSRRGRTHPGAGAEVPSGQDCRGRT